ncbi:MAG: hypothetical protein ACRCXT_08425 [Paraclostridium sp.]
MKKSILVLAVLVGGLFLINPIKEQTFAQDNNKNLVVEQSTKLTQEDALQLLINHNNELTYMFQGTSNDFDSLVQKGLNGYVFLPDVDTDLGYFIDETTSNIYYFHPSGYLELIK